MTCESLKTRRLVARTERRITSFSPASHQLLSSFSPASHQLLSSFSPASPNAFSVRINNSVWHQKLLMFATEEHTGPLPATQRSLQIQFWFDKSYPRAAARNPSAAPFF
jgi:hypothetical protein